MLFLGSMHRLPAGFDRESNLKALEAFYQKLKAAKTKGERLKIIESDDGTDAICRARHEILHAKEGNLKLCIPPCFGLEFIANELLRGRLFYQ